MLIGLHLGLMHFEEKEKMIRRRRDYIFPTDGYVYLDSRWSSWLTSQLKRIGNTDVEPNIYAQKHASPRAGQLSSVTWLIRVYVGSGGNQETCLVVINQADKKSRFSARTPKTSQRDNFYSEGL